MSVSSLEKLVYSLPFSWPVVTSKESRHAQCKAEKRISTARILHGTAELAIRSIPGRTSLYAQQLQADKMEELKEAAAHLEKKRIYCLCGIASNILSIAIISVVALSLFPIISLPLALTATSLALGASPFIVWTGTCIYDIYQTNKSFESIRNLEAPAS